MVTARAFLSLLAGFAAMAAIVIVMTVLLRWLAPEWVGIERRPRAGYVFVNLGYSFLAAAAGGYVTAWAAGMSPLPSVLALAVVVWPWARSAPCRREDGSRPGISLCC